MADDWREQIGFLRGLDGISAHILLALLVAGRRLTVDDLAMASGCDKRTVKRGLALLEALGLVEVDADGWALPAAVRERLTGAEEGGGGGARTVRAPSSSSSVSNSLNPVDEKKKKKDGANGAARANGATRANGGQAAGGDEVAGLLQRAGIGRGSPKMRQLLGAGLDAGYVREHVTAREAVLARGDEYPVGWLINKLECGDPAPVCRCGRCEACRERMYANYPTVMR